MPSSRSSRRTGAVTRRQTQRPRVSTREIDPEERKYPPAPLPPEIAARSAADRADAETARDEARKVRRQIEQAKREARAAGDDERVQELDRLSRRFQASAPGRASTLDRY